MLNIIIIPVVVMWTAGASIHIQTVMMTTGQLEELKRELRSSQTALVGSYVTWVEGDHEIGGVWQIQHHRHH